MELVGSWKTIFTLAGKCGQAKMALIENPSPENEEAYQKAVEEHDNYRDFCLRADRMVHFPDLR